MSTETGRAGAQLPRTMLFCFSLPTLVLGFTHGPEGQIQAIYAKHAGLALTAVALAGLLSKLLDAVTYPLIGYLSDRSYERSGSRRSWVVSGCAVSMLGVWFLMRPPEGASVIYFGIWMAVTYIGWKLMEIPLQAWSFGLSSDYEQRSRVQAWRVLALVAGQLIFFGTPYLAVQLGYSDSTELDFRSLGVAAVICVAALPLATLILVARVPAGGSAPPPKPEVHRFGVAETFEAMRQNGPLLQLLTAFTTVQLLAGMSSGVAYLYMDAYLGLGAQFPAIMGLSLLSSIAGVPFWTAMASRYERHRVWAIALAIGGVAAAGFAFVSPGPHALPASFVLYPTVLFCLSSVVLVFSMSADIVDFERLQSGKDQSGLYGSLLFFLQKSVGGVSTAAGIALVGWFGFDAAAEVQSGNGTMGIKLAATVLPALGLISGAIVIWNYSLTRARMERINTDLAKRAAR
jgi:GPH family glycoside/pentoside/hexuronide:cation symporter